MSPARLPARLPGLVGAGAAVLCVAAYVGLQSAPGVPLALDSLDGASAALGAGSLVATSARPHAAAPVSRGGDRADTAAPATADPQWVATTAATVGIPAPAVRAYADAQLNAPEGCEVGWTTLAGIGWVESQHGTIGGRTLGEDGHSSSPILGPALDGTGKVAAIPATPESTTWHGDPRWDHAVGPLQFIPSTWATWASDGDGDGVADPNDLDDAAYAAARYLCADDRDLTTSTGWQQAIFSYNHARSYVDSVHAAATAYAARVS